MICLLSCRRICVAMPLILITGVFRELPLSLSVVGGDGLPRRSFEISKWFVMHFCDNFFSNVFISFREGRSLSMRDICMQAARETGALKEAKDKLEKKVEELTWRLQFEKRLRVSFSYSLQSFLLVHFLDYDTIVLWITAD